MIVMFFCVVLFSKVNGQTDEKIVSASSELDDGLDLISVCELFKESQNLEEFEKSLNDPIVGINNLDLNDDLDVDYIRVIEEIDGDVRFIVLQVPLGYEEFQDVAVIEVLKVDDDNYKMQIQGDENIYGPGYYFAPTTDYIQTWPIIPVIFLHNHPPYCSNYYYGYYPLWWKPYRSSKSIVNHTRISKYKTRNTFVFVNTSSIKNANKIHRVSAKSNLVKKRYINQSKHKFNDTKRKVPVGKKKTRSAATKKYLDKK